MMNVTNKISVIDFYFKREGELHKFRVIPQMVSTLRYDLIFASRFSSRNHFDEKSGSNPSGIPTIDEIKGKSLSRPKLHRGHQEQN